jgi:hypothetical protein
MASLQENILLWRYSNQLPKFIIGFWIKAFIEAGIAIGGLVAAFIFLVTWIFEVSFGDLGVVSIPGPVPEIVTWVLLTGWLWTRERCLMAEGILPEPLREKAEMAQEEGEPPQAER